MCQLCGQCLHVASLHDHLFCCQRVAHGKACVQHWDRLPPFYRPADDCTHDEALDELAAHLAEYRARSRTQHRRQQAAEAAARDAQYAASLKRSRTVPPPEWLCFYRAAMLRG